MSEKKFKLEEIIEYFVLDYLDEEDSDVISGDTVSSTCNKNDIIIAAKEKIRDDIVSQIRLEVRQDIINEYEYENRRKKVWDTLTIIIETFIIACVVGLIVNQITNLINITTYQYTDIKANVTWIWIGGLSILLVIILICDAFSRIQKLI